ncbi:MAG TPA: hypothetical protein VFS43_40820 [Polyangiaceae bacterium]|nr:hypothetical protein [Polyangiaceae bacterium]
MWVSNELGKTYDWASFDASELAQRVRPPEAIAQAQAAMSSRLVVLTGPTGAGKTVLTAAMIRGRSGLKVMHCASHWPRDVDGKVLAACRSAPVLVLDSLDCFRVPPRGPRRKSYLDVGALVWSRVPAGRPTFITTVLTFDQLAGFFPVLAQAGHDLALIDLDPKYCWNAGMALF